MDAKTITQTLGGKWYRRYGAAPCPVCQPERHKTQNALTLHDGSDGRLLVNCKKHGCGFRDILAARGIAPGDYRAPDPVLTAKREAEQRADAEKRERQAQRIWQEAQPINGTVAAHYLRDRMITCDLPETLRFQPACWHGATAKRYPAMVALVEGVAGFAVHRTYLLSDGSGKAAIEPQKAMLGSIQGGAVRLAGGSDTLVVAEGIETALSLSCGLLKRPATIWAALSTSGLTSLILPVTTARLTIAPDGDAAGRAAAHALAERAHALGWTVSLLPAPDGRDWNDILCMKGAAK